VSKTSLTKAYPIVHGGDWPIIYDKMVADSISIEIGPVFKKVHVFRLKPGRELLSGIARCRLPERGSIT
jgi:hypothetical protein